MSANGVNEVSGLSGGAGAIGQWIADRLDGPSFTAWLGMGAAVGAVVGATTAMRSHPDDVISGQVSIDLLKKVELLTIRLKLHRSGEKATPPASGRDLRRSVVVFGCADGYGW